MLEIRDVRIDSQIHSAVTDNSAPEVSFALFSDVPDAFLKSAQVKVCGETLQCGCRQTGIRLPQLEYKPFTVYDVTVSAVDNHGQKAEDSVQFQTGRLGMPWDAKWITDQSYQFGKKISPAPMTFRRMFKIPKPVRRAYITSTAMGIYELMLNGEKVGEDYFAPGFTSYQKNLQYQLYDVTGQLAESNTLIAVVAGGWAVGRFTYESKNKITTDRQALLLELFIEYTDSSTEKIVTDENWEVTTAGNYQFACLYDGETYDATIELENAPWKKADVTRLKFIPQMTVSNGNMVRRHEMLKPTHHFKNSDREWIYDFGQNFAGVVSLQLKGKQGQRITVRHAEVLESDYLYTKSLRTAKATAIYICRDGEQSYSPRLTYMGFRYIGITGIEPENVEVAAYALYSDFEQTGSFECSNELLNKLQSNILWAGKSNFVDIPTDCPQRDERQGWTGDISIFASTACYNFDLSRFLEKWLKDVRLEQGRGGGIPMVVPRHGNTPPVVATACWGDSCILVPWAEYLARGSTELLRRQYHSMKKFMKAVKFWASLYGPGDRKYIFKWLFQFGDWCAPQGYIKDWLGRGKWMGTAYYANSSRIMAQIAAILGETEDQEYYENLYRNICRAFRNVLTDGQGKLLEEFQTGYVLPLYFQMEDGEIRQAMSDNLNRLVVENDYHLATGFPGTPYILFALADNGHADTAFRLLLQDTCPSWLYCVKMGATTFWEQWNAITPEGEIRDPSMNHYAYGAVGDFLYRRILGIEATVGGYRKFRMKPLLGGGITWAKGHTQTAYGKIEVSWYVEENQFTIHVTVPVSAQCELVMPSGKKTSHYKRPAPLFRETREGVFYMKFQVFGVNTPEESAREREHRALARQVAAEGIVLLENNGVLPLKPQKVALYGPGSRMTVKGGSGSGDVRERYSITIEEGLKNAGFLYPTTLWMDRFQKKYDADVATWRNDLEEQIKKYNPIQTMQMFCFIGEHPMPYPSCTPIREDELTDETDTAIYVLSRQAGEGRDRRVEKDDYLLSDVEEDSLRLLRKHYKKLILVLNCGSVMDLKILDEISMDAVLSYGQGGTEGGNALADILTGKVSPSGHLTDTWAKRYEDYPCADTFGHRNGDLENEEYTEGIYVGYRWFEQKNIVPRYPFGHGLSYTTFEHQVDAISEREVMVTVANTARYSGKEVLRLFVSKPDGKLGHEKRSLVSFAKTKTLAPGESQRVTISFDLSNIASFDVSLSAFILEAGSYALILNDSEIGSFTLEERILETVQPIGTDSPEQISQSFTPKVQYLLEKLSDWDKIQLVVGGGYSIRCYNNVMGAAGRTCTKLLKKGIPNIVLADGPAGLNVNQSTTVMPDGTPRYPDGLPVDWQWGWLKKVGPLLKDRSGKGKTVYRYMTAWPSETVQAQTWNTDLVSEIGQAVGKGMLEIGVSVWLAPGLNIHRNPLCGRNFEYYSEDPVLSGKMAAAITQGVQSMGGVGVAQKHYCCNNQEDNRTGVSANVSQRALREIYLRAFRIAVTEGKPWTVMSSYNRVNRNYVCNSYDFCTRVLRQEWGFEGLVMSDWNATEQCSYAEAINAGNDLIMPGTSKVAKQLKADLKAGKLNRTALNLSAGRVLELIFKSDTCKEF